VRRLLPLLSLAVADHELGIPAVVLLDVLVRAIKLQRLAVLLGRLFEVAVRFIGDGEIVVRQGIAGIELHRPLKAKHRLPPQIHSRHLHAKGILAACFGQVGASVRAGGHREEAEHRHKRAFQA